MPTRTPDGPASPAERAPRILVQVVAYNAAATLAKVLDRIPESVREQLTEICVFDDASKDDTFLVGQGYKLVRGLGDKLQVLRNATARGYGGNQKIGFRYAIERGFDVVVLLHGDGQYAPEVMPELLAPVLAGEADAVVGSRMLEPGAARRGGMPLYKLLGIKTLSTLENALLGTQLSEWHSGYRVYSVDALAHVPFDENSDGFDFDTQLLIQLKAGGYRIREVPIPTYAGREIQRVKGVAYAKDVMRAVVRFRAHQAGLVHRPEYAHSLVPRYEKKDSLFSSHHKIVEAVRPGSRVLDVGCAGGYLARALAGKGCTVIGVDLFDDAAARAACARFHVVNLEDPTWAPSPEDRGERGFDYVLYGDVLEHLRDTSILARSRAWLAPGGRVVASTGNIALWVMRLSLLAGKFRYMSKGILDETHVRLYTRETFRELVEQAGFHVVGEDVTVVPVKQLSDQVFGNGRVERWMGLADQLGYQLGRAWPELFAYQFVLTAESGPARALPDGGEASSARP